MNRTILLASTFLFAFLNPSVIPTQDELEDVIHNWDTSKAVPFLESCPLDLIQSNGARLMKLAVLRYTPSRMGDFKEPNWDTQLLKPLVEKFGLKMTESHLKTALDAASPKELFIDMVQNGAEITPGIMGDSLYRGDLVVYCAKQTGQVNYVDPASGKTVLMLLCQSQWHQKHAFELLEAGADPCIQTSEGSVAAELLSPHNGLYPGGPYSKFNTELLVALVQYGFRHENINPDRYCFYEQDVFDLIKLLPQLIEDAKYELVELGDENPTPQEIRKKTMKLIEENSLTIFESEC